MNPDLETLTSATEKTVAIAAQSGFLGIGAILIIIVAPIAMYVIRSTNLALATAICGAIFLSIFGLINIVSTVWPDIIINRPNILFGKITNVAKNFRVNIVSNVKSMGNAYTKTIYNSDIENQKDSLFLYVTPSEPNCLTVAITRTDSVAEDGNLAFHVSPISKKDMDGTTELTATVITSKSDKKPYLEVVRESRGKLLGEAVKYYAIDDSDPGCKLRATTSMLYNIFWSAMAQNSSNNLEIWKQKLTSDDVFTRRNSRIELSTLGSAGAGDLEALIQEDDNYRIQLGAAVAISVMPVEQRKLLPDSIKSKLVELKSARDPTMSATAARALAGWD